MNFLHNQPAVASGSVRPCRFLVIDTTKNFAVKESIYPDAPICGISGAGSKNPPGLIEALDPSLTGSDVIANDGDGVNIFGPGDVCLVEVGSSGVTAGDYLKNDLNACAIKAAAGDPYGAQAWQSGQPGEKIQVQVLVGTVAS